MQTINLVNKDGTIWEITHIPNRTANAMEKLARRLGIPEEQLYLQAIDEGLRARSKKGGRK